MSKITLKDCISWALVLIFGIIATVQGCQKGSVSTSLRVIKQNKEYNNFPPLVKDELDKIGEASAPIVNPSFLFGPKDQ